MRSIRVVTSMSATLSLLYLQAWLPVLVPEVEGLRVSG